MNSRRAFLRGLAGAAREAAAAGTGIRTGASPARADLSAAERDRYAEQLAVPGWSEAAQAALRDASVLVIGAGALGSPVAAYLAGAGVGRIGIADGADVVLPGLHRQHLHFTPDAGVPKATSAAAKLRFLNPGIVVEPYQVRFEDANAAGLVAGHDLVADCTGAPPTRYVADRNAACCGTGIALVTATLDGVVMAIRPGETPCWRCAFPEAEPDEPLRLLGPAAGVLGSLQALEAMRLLSGRGTEGGYLRLDLGGDALRRVPATRRADCPDCGTRTL